MSIRSQCSKKPHSICLYFSNLVSVIWISKVYYMASSKKKEETDLFDLLKDLAKNWRIMVPCIFLAGIIGVFVAFWIRPVYKVDALLQIESKSNKSVGMLGGLPSLFATSSPAATEIELIKSRHIIGETIEKMHLQYRAIPVNSLDRLLHREGRMELSRYEVPWSLVPQDEKIVPWKLSIVRHSNCTTTTKKSFCREVSVRHIISHTQGIQPPSASTAWMLLLDKNSNFSNWIVLMQ